LNASAVWGRGIIVTVCLYKTLYYGQSPYSNTRHHYTPLHVSARCAASSLASAADDDDNDDDDDTVMTDDVSRRPHNNNLFHDTVVIQHGYQIKRSSKLSSSKLSTVLHVPHLKYLMFSSPETFGETREVSQKRLRQSFPREPRRGSLRRSASQLGSE